MIAGMEGKVAVVTGGASGIGGACAALLRACRRRGRRRRPGRASGRSTSPTARRSTRSRPRSRRATAELDILVNAAGVLTPNAAGRRAAGRRLPSSFDVNVLGTLNACQAFAPLLRDRRGAVVNIASQAALVSLPQQARLHGREGRGRGADPLARDRLGRRPASASTASVPGFTRTPMTDELLRERGLHGRSDPPHPARPHPRGRRRSRVRSSSSRARWRRR